MVEVVKNLFEFLKKKDTIDPLKTLFEDVKKNIPQLKDTPKTDTPKQIPSALSPLSTTPGGRKKPRRGRKQRPLWDIPGISSAEKAEIMRIVSETQKIKDDTEEQIRMLVPDYKQPKPKKPQPVRRTKPSVVTRQTEPPAKRRQIKAPIVDQYDRPLPPIPTDDDVEYAPPLPPRDAPPPLPPRDAPPPLPPRDVPTQQYYNVPPPPEEEAPEPPMEVEEISVPVKTTKPTLADEIRQTKQQLRHVPPPITTGVNHPSDLAKVLQRRVYIAPSDDEDDDGEWDGYGHSQGLSFTTPEEIERWNQSWGGYI